MCLSLRTFYRLSLLLPVVVPLLLSAISYAIGSPSQLPDLLRILIAGGYIGGIPYLVLAWWLQSRMRRTPYGSLTKLALKAPLYYLPLLCVFLLVASFGRKIITGSGIDIDIIPIVMAFAVPVAYGYVALAVALGWFGRTMGWIANPHSYRSTPPKAVVLLSGGLDSATVAAMALAEGYEVHALSFRYGQRHMAELEAAKRVAESLGITHHRVIDLDLRAIGGSALTSDTAVPKHRETAEMSAGIPVTYVPARNTIFIALALGVAEVVGAEDIFLGVNAIDYSGYPDCRPEYIAAYEQLANLATAAAVEGRQRIRLRTPLIRMTKAEIIREGRRLGVDYDLTLSCYDPTPEGAPCGACDACLLRAKGFREAGDA
jgi:7-cyano-7-deazaguanine synthase